MQPGGLGNQLPGAIDNTSRSIRIPIHKLNEYRVIRKKFGQFRAKHGRDPVAEELEVVIRQAAEEDSNIKVMTADEIEMLGRILYPMVYLDKANSEDENLTIMDYLSSEESEQPEVKIESHLNNEYLKSLLDQLEPEEKMLIMLRYGLIDGKSRDKRELATTVRGNESEVQKKIDAILAKLKLLGDKEKANLE